MLVAQLFAHGFAIAAVDHAIVVDVELFETFIGPRLEFGEAHGSIAVHALLAWRGLRETAPVQTATAPIAPIST